MALRDKLRKLAPGFLLNWYRGRKKTAVRRTLEEQRVSGNAFRQEELLHHLRAMGIVAGDTLLVHSSLSKIGYVEGGPEAIVDVLLEAVGPTGHVLMPNSPNAGYQLEYIQTLDVFDVRQSASKLGAITEAFRKRPEARRSVSATEPVSCIGPDAAAFVDGHYGQTTPYTSESPFYKVAERGGKILYIGVTLANAGTSLHLLEDAVEAFPFPVYYPQVFNVKVRLENGEEHLVQTKVHNPGQSAKRRCDELIPLFEQAGVLTKERFGNAEVLLVDAKGMLESMLRWYEEKEVTMYTPGGS